MFLLNPKWGAGVEELQDETAVLGLVQRLESARGTVGIRHVAVTVGCAHPQFRDADVVPWVPASYVLLMGHLASNEYKFTYGFQNHRRE